MAVINKLLAFTLIFISTVKCQDQSVYQYFADTANLTGLVAENQEFRLNGKYIRIISGAIHYFRVHPDLWRDRLRKLRATGANTVESYVPWNLHEPRKGEFDFGNGSNDFSIFLDVQRFLRTAQEEDLLVIIRPGPYICAEWEYGGYPSWLQRDPDMQIRSEGQPYLDRVKIFLDAFVPQISDFKFTNGGCIIAAQIENEYGSFNPKSTHYLETIRQGFLDNGLDCLHFTCDNHFNEGSGGSLPGLLQTANFKENPDQILGDLLRVQPDKPIMVMEFWTGWFTNWFDERRGGSDPSQFRQVLETIFSTYNGSVNFYMLMFHGGTNFGFTAGGGDVGDIGAPDAYAVADITSYDYDAPLTEAGDYTVKYEFAAELISQYENPKLRRPLRPIQSQKTAYPTLQLQRYLNYTDIIMEIPSSHKILQDKPVSMELLPINNGNGQTFGYIIYRKVANFSPGDRYKVSRPKDLAELLIDGELVDTGFTNAQPQYWFNDIHDIALNVSSGEHTIDLFVDVIARTNWGGRWEHFNQQKGLPEITGSKIEINNIEIQGVEIIALEFTQAWVNGLENWKTVEDDPAALKGPCLVQSSFTIPTTPTDTFLNMSGWHKGVVFVNGFNVGRYWKVGPQQNLYVPAPLLNTGINTIIVFEQFEPSDSIVFSNIPNLGPPFLP